MHYAHHQDHSNHSISQMLYTYNSFETHIHTHLCIEIVQNSISQSVSEKFTVTCNFIHLQINQ